MLLFKFLSCFIRINKFQIRVEAGIMRRMVLWDTACNFNGFISNQSIFNIYSIGRDMEQGIADWYNTSYNTHKHDEHA